MLRLLVCYLNPLLPLDYQENYDNSGLVTWAIRIWRYHAALLCIDVTEAVMEEAIANWGKSDYFPSSGYFQSAEKNYRHKPIPKESSLLPSSTILHFTVPIPIWTISSEGLTRKFVRNSDLCRTRNPSPLKNEYFRKLVTFVPHESCRNRSDQPFLRPEQVISENTTQCSFNTEGTGKFQGICRKHIPLWVKSVNFISKRK